MKLKKALIGSTLLAAFVSAPAYSFTVNLPTGVSILEDDNKEIFFDVNGNVKTSGLLAVGDKLRAVVTMSSVNNPDNSVFQNLGLGESAELTGLSEIEVASIAGGVIVFKPSASFEAVYGIGAMGAVFADSTPDLNMGCATQAICEAATINGSPWMTIGFADDDDFWVAGGAIPGVGLDTIDIATIAAGSAATKFGVANYALSILTNSTGYTFEEQFSPFSTGTDKMTDIIGSGDILGGAGLTGGYLARSDFDFQIKTVPEPGTLALLGLGLLGVAGTRKRSAK